MKGAERLEDRRVMATLTVDTTLDQVDGNTTSIGNLLGSPGADGFISLREAITAANNTAGDDVIQFAPSTNGVPFTLSILNPGGNNEDANASGDLDVLGAGGGLTIVGNGASQTIIQAGTDNTNGIDKVFAFNPICDAAADFSLSDVTVRFGRNTQPYGVGDFSDTGAGIDYCGFGASSFTLSNSVIDQNTNVNSRGGGLNIDEVGPATSTVTITNTQFTNNTSFREGAGVNIYGDNAQVTISGSTFSSNQANSLGGGLSIRLTNQDDGDFAPTPSVQIDHSLFTANSAIGIGSGGGIAVFGAGGVQSVDISNTTISGNASTVDGGGLFVDDALSIVTLTNVTITNNIADSDNNNVADNGGGINRQNGTVLLNNTLVAGNFRQAGATRDDINGSVDAAGESNLVGDGTGMAGLVDGVNGNQVGTGGSPIIPLLGPLANNGGLVRTHALLNGSPALDAGNNALIVGTTDNRGPGFPRILDSDDGNLIATVDIGAFERFFSPPTTSVGLVGGDLVITDSNGGTSDDDITLTLDGTDVLVIDPLNVLQAGSGATNDDPHTVRVPLASIAGKILVNTLAGNDGVTVDSTNGLFPRQIEFDGGDGFDSLQFSQTGGPTRDSGFLGVGNEPGNGASFIDTQLVVFRNLEPIIDNVPAATFTISGIPGLATLLDADNAINYATSSIFGAAFGQVTVDNFEPIHFSNKTSLVVDAGAGADAINLNNPNTPTGLTNITVNGGDGADVVTVNGTANNEAIEYSPTSATSANISIAGLPGIAVTAAEAVEIDGQNNFGDDDLLVDTFFFDGTMVLTPGSTADSGLVDFYAGPDFTTFHGPALSFRNLGAAGSVSFDDGFRLDNLIYQGTSGDDNFEVDQDGTVVLNGQLPVFTPSFITLTLAGLTGSDRFEVSPLASDIQLNVEGGGQAGDVLLVNETLNPIPAAQFQVSPNFSNNLSDTGIVSEAISNTLINYAGIATVQLFATGDDDAVQIFDDLGTNTWKLARGPSIFLESSQVQIDGRTPIQLENFSLVDLVNLGGVDRFVVAPDRLPNLPTTYNLTGLLSGGTFRDTLEIQGTGQGDNPVTLTDTAITLGTSVNYSQMAAIVVNTAAGNDLLEVDASAGPVTTPIFFDGGIGSDTLRVTGAAGGQFDEVIYTPGADPTSGALVYENAANTALMRINFTGLEPVLDNTTATTLTVNGNGANNSITYTNGPSGVFFGGNPTGLVSVDNGETIEFNNKTNLVLNAGAGDDVITLNGTVAPFGLASLTVNGGTPSASDKLVIVGTALVDSGTFTPTSNNSGTFTGLAVPVTFATVEHVVYDGNDSFGTDNVTINGTLTNDTFDFDAVSFTGRYRSPLSPDFDTVLAGRITVNGGIGGADVVNLFGSAAADVVTSAANAISVSTPGSGAIITLGASVDALTVSTLGGNDSINLSGVLAPITTTVYGGLGDDTIVGSPQADLLYGGDGNDVIIGGAGVDVAYGDAGDDQFGEPAGGDPAANDTGNDQFFGGDGSDTLTWDPGDGSDLFEGGAGADVLVFNGSAGAETFTLNAVGPRLELLRDLGGIDMDLAEVEQVELNANGGADVVNVNDLYGTGVLAVAVELGGDGSSDLVDIDGRSTDDELMLTAPTEGRLLLAGLTYNVTIATQEVTDRLVINGNEGNDRITAAPAAPPFMAITLSGGEGDDTLDGNVLNLFGHEGNDLLIGGLGNQTFDGGVGDDTFVGNGGTDNVGGGAGSSLGDTILLAGTSGADTFALSLSPTGQLLATINGVTTTYGNFVGGPIDSSGIEQILVQGLAGNDSLTVDSTNGAISIPINYAGGDNADLLTLTGGVATSNTYLVGPGVGDGTSTIVIGGVTQVVRFSNLEPVLDLVGGPLTVIGTNAANTINYSQGSVAANGLVSVDGFETIEFSNKTVLTLDALAGDDVITINNVNVPTGLTGVTVNGGTPSASDKLVIMGSGAVEAVVFTPTTNNAGTLTGLGAPVTFATVEHVVYDGNDLAAFDNVTINGTLTNDTLDYDANLLEGRFRSFASPEFDTLRSARIAVNGGGSGADVVNLFGSAGADSVTSAANAISVQTPATLAIITLGAGIDALTVSTLASADSVNLSGVLAPITTTVYGGEGDDSIVGSPQADLLYGGDGNDVIIGGAGVDVAYGDAGNDRFGDAASGNGVADDAGNDQFFGGSGSDTLVWDPGDGSDLFEGGDGTDAMIFNGSAGAETFTFNAVGSRLEFLRSVGAIDMDLANVEQVNLNANGGADVVTVNDLFNTGVQSVLVNLGTDAATDAVTINGRTTNDSLTLTSPAAGQLQLNGLTYTVGLSTTEVADTLTINGNEGDDQITAAPFAETVMTITLNGGLGNDSLTGNVPFINGQEGNDLLVGGLGNQTFDGGDGDDTFVGNGGTDNVGGGAGSSVGDTILLAGTSGADTFALSLSPTGQLIATINGLTTTYGNFIGGPIATSGIEQILVEGLAGNDGLTVDSTNGAIAIPINFAGGDNADLLTLTGGVATSNTYQVGPGVGDGTSTIVIGGVTQVVRFSNLEPVLDLVGGPLTVVGTNAANSITYRQGSVAANGLVSIDGFETIEFSNKATLDLNGQAGADVFTIDNATVPTGLTAISVNGGASQGDSVVVYGTTGSDAITYSPTGLTSGSIAIVGLPTVTFTAAEQAVIDGRGGTDSLTHATPAGTDQVTYTPGSASDAGTITTRQAGAGAAYVPLAFSQLGAIGSVNFTSGGGREDVFELNGTQNSDIFSVNQIADRIQISTPTGAFVTVALNTPGVSLLNLRGLDGDDTFNVAATLPYTSGVLVDGGNPSASDVLNFSGSGAGAVTVNLGASTVVEAGFSTVSYSSVETINASTVAGNNPSININDTAGDDDLVVTVLNANQGSVVANGVAPTVNYTNANGAPVNFPFTAGGEDTLRIVGNALTQTISANANALAVNLTPPQVPVALALPGFTAVIDDLNNGGADGQVTWTASLESLELFGLEGNDTFNVVAGLIPVFVDGGDPIGIQPGDVINVVAAVPSPVTFQVGPESDEGGFKVGTQEVISFDHIESLGALNAICAIILGTNGDDDITVIARDASTHAGTDGVQDFTTSVNAGPDILWINTPELHIDVLAGDDHVVIRTPAPNLAAWNVEVDVAGGTPSSPIDGDRLEVETPGQDTTTYTPTGSDTGVLNIINANGQVAIINIGPFTADCDGDGIDEYVSSAGGFEELWLDGEGANDSLTIIGTVASDLITHTPGAGRDEGSIRVNEMLAISYQNLGLSATLTVNGGPGGRADQLIAKGTGGSDTMVAGRVSAAIGTVAVNSQLVIRTEAIEIYTLDALEGNDRFIVTSPLADDVGTVNTLGGGPGGSDVLEVFGQFGVADTFSVTPGQTRTDGLVEVNNVDVNYTGVEHLQLNAGADVGDALFVRATSNLGDNLWTVNAGDYGGDRVQIDNRESIDFQSFDDVELINQFGTDLFRVYPSSMTQYNSLNIIGDAAGGGRPIDDVLEVYGTPAADTVTSDTTTITLNGKNVSVGGNLIEVQVNALGGDDSVTLGLSVAGTRKVVDGGDGNDTINVSTMVDATIFGGLGDDNITGSPIADLIYGGSGNDVIVGLGGNDTIYGDAGDDTITGSTGNDALFGGDGSDRFIWNNGDNTDVVEGDEGVDVQVINGSTGATGDVFVLGANPSNEARALFQRTNLVPFSIDMGKVEQVDMNTGDGNDTVAVNDLFTTDVTTVNVNVGGDALLDAVTVEGRTTADSVTLSRYLTTGVNIAGLKYDVNVLALDPINDADTLTFNANGGDDVVSAQDALSNVFGSTFAQVNRLIINGGDGDDSLSGFGNLNGNDGEDTLIGGNFGQLITGGNDADFLNGGGGDDTLNGGAGEDQFIGGAGADTIDGGDVAGVIEWDTILVNGTSGNDTINVNQTLPTSLTYTVNTNTQTDTVVVLGDGTRTVDAVRVDAGAGADLIRVKTADAAVNSMATDGVFNHIVTIVHGGSATGAGDRLVIVDDLADDLTLYRKGQDVTEGNVTIGPGNAEPYETQFDGIERVQFVDENGAAINQDAAGATSRLVMFETDLNEYNDDRFLSTILGAPLTTSLGGTIDPGAILNPFGDGQNIPGDEDWFKVQANVTGTLDFTTLFEEVGNIVSSGRPGLPGNGDLDIYVYDIDGTLIAGNGGTFGGNNGTGLNPELNVDGDVFAENERVRISAVAGQSYIVRVIGRAPAGNPTALTGTINAFNLSVTNVAAPVPFDIELQDNPISGVTNPPGTNGNSDTGRTQFDNHTYDNTPTFIFRLDDGVLLNDLPGNNTSTLPPDEITSIPFRPGLAQPALAGYAIAIFDEGATAPAAGNAGNLNVRQPLGFATQIEPGLYTFTVPAGLELNDGSHFITARVQMLDPATPLQTGWGERSVSLEIVVDRVAPPTFFGYTNLADTQHGLAAVSDSGVNGYPATNVDRVTNDTTPTFYGTAEANAVVRLYVESNGVAGLQSRESGAANPDLFIGLTAANPLDGSNQFPNGNWELTSALDLNNPNLGGFFTQDGVRRIYVTGEDLAGNITADAAADVLNIFLDTRGPQVTRVDVNTRNNGSYNIWDHKGTPDGTPGTLVPTPLVNSIVVSVQDLPARSNVDPNFLYDALFTPVSIDPGLYTLVGDHNGIIPINTITFTADPAANGVIATGFVTITFFEALPDDRFTLVLKDGITDRVGNNLDGESNTGEPHDNVNTLPSGDGVPGGDFVARFTVDSRAEIGAWISGGAYVDINGNFTFDPQNPDFVNRDIQYKMQYPEVGPMTDQVFTTDEVTAGKFTPVGAVANDGFDRLAAYGYTGGVFRWLVDTDNNGVADQRFIEPKAINGFPVAGNFDGNAANGDEVAIFTGTTWWLDTNHNYVTDVSVASSVKGYPIVGDFDGDGQDDLGVWSDDKFSFDLASNGYGTIDDTIAFGFLGVRERPVAADMDGDRVDDIGLWVPDRAGQAPAESAEWYFLVSNFPTPAQKAAATGTANLLDHPFTPIPFGKDLYAQYGNSYAMPVIGNFDPPATTTGGTSSSGNALDVNGDGSVSPIDALLVINYLNNPSGEAAAANSGFQMDTSRDGSVAPIDALLVINYLNAQQSGEGEGADESVAPIALAPLSPAASIAPIASATSSAATVEEAVDALFADAVPVSAAAVSDDLFDLLAQEDEDDQDAHDLLFGQL